MDHLCAAIPSCLYYRTVSKYRRYVSIVAIVITFGDNVLHSTVMAVVFMVLRKKLFTQKTILKYGTVVGKQLGKLAEAQCLHSQHRSYL